METKKGPQVPDVENIFFYNKIISSTIIVITRFVKVTILNYLNRLMQKLISTNISVRHLLFECVYT